MAGASGPVIAGLSVIGVIAAALLVILLPMSFSYLDFHEVWNEN